MQLIVNVLQNNAYAIEYNASACSKMEHLKTIKQKHILNTEIEMHDRFCYGWIEIFFTPWYNFVLFLQPYVN